MTLSIGRKVSHAAFLLFAKLSISLLLAQSAQAGDCSEVLPGTWTCSGPASAGDTGVFIAQAGAISVSTLSGFGLDVTDGSYGFELDTQSDITFTDGNASNVTTNGFFGLAAFNSLDGGIYISSNGSITSTGAGGAAVHASNSVGSTDIVVHVNDTTGDGSGIDVAHSGTGRVEIVSTGMASGDNLNGIRAVATSGSAMTIRAHDTSGGNEGIYASNGTVGALEITSTGLAKGGNDRGILADNTGTDVTVIAVDAQGGSTGIQVNNFGSGHATITATGTVSNTGIAGLGIIANTGADSGGLTITAHNVEGTTTGIFARHQSNSGDISTIITTGHVMGGSGSGIETETIAGVLTVIEVQNGSIVEATSGSAITNNVGDSNVTIATGGQVYGAINLGLGGDAINLYGGFSGITTLDGGGGGTDVMNLTNASSASHHAGNLQNWTVINLDNSHLTLTGSNITVGSVADPATGIFLTNGSTLRGSQNDFSITGNLNVAAGTQFLTAGGGAGANVIGGDLINGGTVSMAGGGSGDQIIVQGTYLGIGGAVLIETFLGSDASPSDQLIIDGGTASGTSLLSVTNAGGAGDLTQLNGILVVDTINGGTTVPGLFTLAAPVVAGPYEYSLYRGSARASQRRRPKASIVAVRRLRWQRPTRLRLCLWRGQAPPQSRSF